MTYLRRALYSICLFILLGLSVLSAGEVELEYLNNFDGSKQKAAAYIPTIYTPSQAHPLLIIAHYMGGNRYTARRQGFYEACEKRGWLLVCPELHGKNSGGETSLAALEAQYDVLGSLHAMQQLYHIDTTRIYMAGRSMGGMLTQIMAAKYPDIIAAGVAGQGISDLRRWLETTIPRLRNAALPETGPYNRENEFEFERRSSINFAPNFRYVPVILWHGTNDTWVLPEQTERLDQAIRKYNPYQTAVFWLQGAAHAPQNFTAEWVCDRLLFFQNVSELGMKLPHRFYPELNLVTDEAKRYFWLYIKPDDPENFAAVSVSLQDSVLTCVTENVAELDVDLSLIPETYRPAYYQLNENGGTMLTVSRKGELLLTIPPDGSRTGGLSID